MTQIGGLSEQVQQEAESVLAAILGGTEALANITNIIEVGDSGAVSAVAEAVNGQVQSILVVNDTAVEEVVVNNGLFETMISATAGIDINSTASETALAGGEEVATYLNTQLTANLSAPDADVLQASLETVNLALQAAGVTSANVQVTEITTAEGSTNNAVVLDFSVLPEGADSQNVVQSLVMDSTSTVQIIGATAVVATGGGTVEIGGGVAGQAGTLVAGDTSDQTFIGGLGADTMIGGAGNDSIVGGAGDTIGFNAAGNTSISGFGDESSSNGPLDVEFYFQFEGINNVVDVNSHITHVLGMETAGTANEQITYVFDTGMTVTLVGVTADQVLAEMVTFTL